MNYETTQLLKRLSANDKLKVKKLERESDLTDDCKYILYYNEEYTDGEVYGGALPVRSIAEAVLFVREAIHK